MQQSLEISSSNKYHLYEELGRGRFGTINRCFSAATNTFYACKSIPKSFLSDPTDCYCLLNEPKIMSFLSLSPHPNIVHIHDFFDSDHVFSLVIDLCQPFTLHDLIVKSDDAGFPEPHAAAIMTQLLSALAHCHRLGVVHRDVKPENVLFDEVERVKLADFGSAGWVADAGEEGMSGVVGTPYYVAPEVVMGREYNEKVDVWSAGVVLYVMLAGVPPFHGETVEEIFAAVVRGNLRFPPRIFRNVSPAAKDLMRKMICRDVSRRLSAEQALRHPWILNGGEATSID